MDEGSRKWGEGQEAPSCLLCQETTPKCDRLTAAMLKQEHCSWLALMVGVEMLLMEENALEMREERERVCVLLRVQRGSREVSWVRLKEKRRR